MDSAARNKLKLLAANKVQFLKGGKPGSSCTWISVKAQKKLSDFNKLVSACICGEAGFRE